MDESLRMLRRVALLLLLPIAAVATIILVVAIALLYYVRAFGVGLVTLLSLPFAKTPPPEAKFLPVPHFPERARQPFPGSPSHPPEVR